MMTITIIYIIVTIFVTLYYSFSIAFIAQYMSDRKYGFFQNFFVATLIIIIAPLVTPTILGLELARLVRKW